MLYIKNISITERILRSFVGVISIACAVLWLEGVWRWVILASAVILVLTGFIGFCPACALVGRRMKKQNVE